MREPIVLDELGVNYKPFALPEFVAAELSRTGLVSVDPARGDGMWKLSPIGRVGAVQVGDVLVSVTPKNRVGVSQLLFLLGYAKDPGFRPEDVDGLPETDLWAALGESLARQGARALNRGALHGYVYVEDALRTVRGRIRVADQLSRRPGMLLPLEVSFDEHTVDITENQILRTAIQAMLHVPRLDDDVRRRLRHLDTKLEGVSLLR